MHMNFLLRMSKSKIHTNYFLIYKCHKSMHICVVLITLTNTNHYYWRGDILEYFFIRMLHNFYTFSKKCTSVLHAWWYSTPVNIVYFNIGIYTLLSLQKWLIIAPFQILWKKSWRTTCIYQTKTIPCMQKHTNIDTCVWNVN